MDLPRPDAERPDASAAPDGRDALAACEELVRRGDPLAAYEHLARPGTGPGDAQRRQLLATALCELGDPVHALEVLAPLADDDPETLGRRGRALKDMALAAGDPAERAERLRRAREAYEDGFRRTRSTWHGINAATLACLAGDDAGAGSLAEEVLALCRREDPRDVWVPATCGEAHLLLGHDDEALAWYARAGVLGRGRWRDLKSARHNAHEILARRDASQAADLRRRLHAALPIPAVGVCVGHRVDAPERPTPRLPPERADAVGRALAAWIEARGVGFGVVAAAAGGDLLFAEALLDRDGAELDLVLPYPEASFVPDSVAYAGARWEALYERARRGARRTTVCSRHRFAPGSTSYEYANAYLEGRARLRAEALGTHVARVAVWDGRAGDGPGGTHAMVLRWREAGVPFDVVDPADPEAGARPAGGAGGPQPPAVATGGDARVVAVMFGDAVGFSRLDEVQVSSFVREFLGEVAREVQRWSGHVLVRDTWGDGLLFVFGSVDTAGRFALALQRRVSSTDWSARGLPADMGLRVGLHAGPATLGIDPISGKRTALGTHVSHAARIEPVTPRGHVYASESFAALAAAESVTTFACVYAGVIPWHKGYGAEPTYRLLARQVSSAPGGDPGSGPPGP